MDGLTHAVCGKYAANKREEWSFPIEHKLRQLAKRPGAYVVALLDCSRQRKTVHDPARVEDMTEVDRQLLISYRCPSSERVIDRPSVA